MSGSEQTATSVRDMLKLQAICTGEPMFRSKARHAATVNELRLTGEDAQATLDSIGDAVLCADVAGNVTYLNPVAERMTGWTASEACGRPLQEVLPIIDAESREPLRSPLAMAIARDATCAMGVNSLLIRRDGRETPIEDSAAPIRDRHGRVTGAVIVFHDVGVARALSLRMSQLAQHDVLTGLPNRLLLNDRLDRAIATARRHDRSLAVLFMDLDGFKRVNDTLGHAAGDQVLQAVARRLTSGVRGSDTVCRQGGDEFVVLLSEVTCAAGAAFSADNLLAAIAAPHRIGDRDLHVTASVGIGVYPRDGTDAETLIQYADLALLRSRNLQAACPIRAIAAVNASRLTPRRTQATRIGLNSA
jgi:diguanylate cyclase (GGDEF)-like protein/PAS domain S-box-containing protein